MNPMGTEKVLNKNTNEYQYLNTISICMCDCFND